MPWTAADAQRHTKLASTLHLQQMWTEIANSALKRTGDDGLAIREANGRLLDYVNKQKSMHNRKRGGK